MKSLASGQCSSSLRETYSLVWHFSNFLTISIFETESNKDRLLPDFSLRFVSSFSRNFSFFFMDGHILGWSYNFCHGSRLFSLLHGVSFLRLHHGSGIGKDKFLARICLPAFRSRWRFLASERMVALRNSSTYLRVNKKIDRKKHDLDKPSEVPRSGEPLHSGAEQPRIGT